MNKWMNGGTDDIILQKKNCRCICSAPGSLRQSILFFPYWVFKKHITILMLCEVKEELLNTSCSQCLQFLKAANFYFLLPQTNRMRWRSHHRHPRHERRRSSRSSSWWLRSVGSRRFPMGPHSPAVVSRASVLRPIRRSCCQKNWRIWTSGAWIYSPFQSIPTTDLLLALCMQSSR